MTTIQFYTGNLVCGNTSEQIDALNFDATVSAYKAAVQAAIPEIAIEWQTIDGEGAEKIYTDDESEKEVIQNAMETVFSQGAFWVNATEFYCECAYCNAELPAENEAGERAVPQDDEEWATEAKLHATGCEWIETRAHTIGAN